MTNRSSGWNHSVARFLPIAALPPPQRLPALLALKEEHQWKWSTVRTYYAAAISALQAAEEPLTIHDKEALRFLDNQVTQELPRVPKAMSTFHFRKLCRCAYREADPDRCRALIAACFAFQMGQRMSDILLLRPQDVKFVPDVGALVITVRRGKTIRTSGPYTLHVTQKNNLFPFMFSWQDPSIQQLFPRSASELIRQHLRLLDQEYELRSIRRGGLQALAAAGFSLEDLCQHFSKHANPKMLMRYLCHGTFSLAQQQLQERAQLTLASPCPNITSQTSGLPSSF